MNDWHDDRSVRFARWWVQRYTAGLAPHDSATRQAEIDSDLAEHRQHRELERWASADISRERIRRLVRGMFADLNWRHELVTGQCRVRGFLRASVVSVTSLAAAALAVFHFAFAAYMLGSTTLADRLFLSGFAEYAEESGPIASVIAALIIAGFGFVLLAASLARPVSPVIANAATIPVAAIAVLFFWLGVWPLGIIVLVGSTFDLATRSPNPTSQP